MKRQTIYYSSFKDNFTKTKLKTKVIDKNYKYIHKNIFYRGISVFLYRFIAMPISYVFVKIKHNVKFKNKKILKDLKSGAFLYANHSMAHADPFIPTFAIFPKRNFLIVHPDNVSQFLVGNIMPMLGAMPLPSDLTAYKNFLKAIEFRVCEQNNIITIYPEASIWPYYNSVRFFDSTSFTYPIKLDKPVYCMTNTFQKKKFSSKPKVTTFIDGPFYPNKELSLKEQKDDLRDRVYSCMKDRCDKYSTYEYIKYVKKGEENTYD